MIYPSPRKYGLSHDKWRTGQWEAIYSIKTTGKKFTTLSAPTGSGKSAMAAALGMKGSSVRAITHTKSLQTQYEQDFKHGKAVYGMGNYPCDLAILPFIKANQCTHADNMNNCPVASRCKYLLARTAAKESDFQILSFAYYLLSQWTKTQEADYLFIDEAHLMPTFLIDQATLSVTYSDIKKYGFAPLPRVLGVAPIDRLNLVKWMDANYYNCRELYSVGKKNKDQSLMQVAQEFGSRFSIVKTGYAQSEEKFYVNRHPDGITIKSTSSNLFAEMLLKYSVFEKVVLASATLGNINRFNYFMGIDSENCNVIEVPSMYTPKETPVRMYNDAPSVNHTNKRGAMLNQVNIMKRIIANETDGHTLIHTASKEDAYFIADKLDTAFPNRAYTPLEKGGTEQKIAAWEAHKTAHKGSITVSWCFGTGVNAPDVHTNIIQKVPYISLDGYGKQLIQNNRSLYMWNAACSVVQACGRNRRGDPSHYDINGQTNKIVAVLDNSFKRIKGFSSQQFQDSIVNL